MSRYYFNTTFLRRFWKVLLILFPDFKSVTFLLFLLLLVLALLEQFIAERVGLIPSNYYQVLGNKDAEGFKQFTLKAVLLVTGMALVLATKKYVMSVFSVMSRLYLTRHLHASYFTDVVYYTLNAIDESVDNPDQRITQDVERLCRVFSSIVTELLISPFTIAYYAYRTWLRTGFIGPLSVFAFFIISTVINKFLMSPVVSLVFRQQELEGDLRFKHTQVRSNCESGALYRCGNVELTKTNEKLDRLISLQHSLNLRQYFLQFSVSIADYFGSILSYLIAAIPIFGGELDQLSPAELAAFISENSFYTIYLIYSFSRLNAMAIDVADIAGITHRIVQLDEVMHEVKQQPSFQLADPSTGRATSTGQASNQTTISDKQEQSVIQVHNLCYSAPNADHRPLLRSLSLQLQAGTNILVSGESGCGKSSLLRVLDGLWPYNKGQISRNMVRGYQGIFVLPQKPYFTDGTLREQISFPYSPTTIAVNRDSWVDDSQLINYIYEAGLTSLFERTGGLDSPVNWNWYDMLSPGEMQRLSFVRLFFHQPPFAFLDEASSQIDLVFENVMYNRCKRLNITLLSIGHRKSLRHHHQKELRFEGDGKWSLQPIFGSEDSDDTVDSNFDIRL